MKKGANFLSLFNKLSLVRSKKKAFSGNIELSLILLSLVCRSRFVHAASSQRSSFPLIMIGVCNGQQEAFSPCVPCVPVSVQLKN